MSHIFIVSSIAIWILVCSVSLCLIGLIVSRKFYTYIFRTAKYIWAGRVLFSFIFYVLVRIFFFDIYYISGYSMDPTLKDGDYIFVSKVQYGPRLPRSLYEIPWLNFLTYLFPFNQLNYDNHTEYKRLASFQNVQHNDILVFNLPVYQPYYAVKRCVGLPGDHIMSGDESRAINRNSTCQIPYFGQQYDLSIDSLSIVERRIIKHYYNDTILSNNKFRLTHAYYFLKGDNPAVSADSRMWGVLQDDHIVGKALFIIFSKDNSNQIRWDRFLKRIR